MNMLKVFQTYFRVVGAVSPKLAAWQGAKLFLTPLPRRSASRWPDALRDTAQHRPIAFGGGKLDAWTWGKGPRVLLVHGWGGIAAHLAPFVGPLVEDGFEVMAFDGPAHGGAPGKQTNVVEFSDLILRIERESPAGLRAVIGHSFGASAVMVAVKHGLQARTVVLISPFSSSDRNIERFSKTLHLSPRVSEATRARLLEVFKDNLYLWDLAEASKDFDAQALIIHDELDKDVPFSESKAIQARWPGARLMPVRGVGHHLILRDTKVVASATQFVSDPASVPSGVEAPAGG